MVNRFFTLIRVQQLLQLNFHIHTGQQIQLHQRVYRLIGRVDDIHQTQMGTNFKLISRSLVDMRGTQHIEALDLGWQWHRAVYHRAGTLGSLNNLRCRLVDQAIIERLEALGLSLAASSESEEGEEEEKTEAPKAEKKEEKK